MFYENLIVKYHRQHYFITISFLAEFAFTSLQIKVTALTGWEQKFLMLWNCYVYTKKAHPKGFTFCCQRTSIKVECLHVNTL